MNMHSTAPKSRYKAIMIGTISELYDMNIDLFYNVTILLHQVPGLYNHFKYNRVLFTDDERRIKVSCLFFKISEICEKNNISYS